MQQAIIGQHNNPSPIIITRVLNDIYIEKNVKVTIYLKTQKLTTTVYFIQKESSGETQISKNM